MNANGIESRHRCAERALSSLGVHLWEARPAEGHLEIDDEARRILGIEEGPVSVSALSRRTHVDDGPGLFEALDAAAREGREFTLLRRFTQADGSTRWWEIRGEIASGESAADRVIAGWMREVHEEHAMGQGVEDLDQESFQRHRLSTIECCADGVAHEFKNVLQIIRGYVSFAKKSLPVECEAFTDLQQALIATDRASDVAHQLLATTRGEDDELDTCDVNKLLSDMGRFLRPILGAKIEIAVASSVEPVAVTGMENSIRQMLINLCLNARDAMPSGGRLLLRAERFSTTSWRDDIGRGLEPGDYARIYVTDNGHGIAAEHRDRLFDPYFTTKHGQQGTGLGLTLVRQLAESCGGGVTAHSEEGVGTTVTLFLPLQSLDAPSRDQSPTAPEGDLLLLGDEPMQSIVALLEAGWHLRYPDPEGEPIDAARAAKEYRAVLIEDKHFPRLRGKAARHAPKSPVLLLTGFDPQSILAETLPAEADAVVATPVDTERLAAVVADLPRIAAEHHPGDGQEADRVVDTLLVDSPTLSEVVG